jgi:hypothetical protein
MIKKAIVFFLLLTSPLVFGQPLLLNYNECFLAWSYDDTKLNVKHYNVFINSNKVAQVPGNIKRINCNKLNFQEGSHKIEVSVVAKNGTESPKASFFVKFCKSTGCK